MRAALFLVLLSAACAPSTPPYLELTVYTTPARASVLPVVGSDPDRREDTTVRVNGIAVPSSYLRSGSDEWKTYSDVPIAADHRYLFEVDDPGAGLLVHEVLADEVVLPPVGGDVRVGDRLPFSWTGSGTPAAVVGEGLSTTGLACLSVDIAFTGTQQAEAVVVEPRCQYSDPAQQPYGDVTLSLELDFTDDPVTRHQVYGSVPMRFVP